jgi:hypothetical protein
LLALVASFAPACSWRGPPLAGFEGLQNQVVGFYRANATERQMSCTVVIMTPVAAEVVEDTPRRVVIDVRYRWTADRARRGRGFGPGFCNGWGQRTFTLAAPTEAPCGWSGGRASDGADVPRPARPHRRRRAPGTHPATNPPACAAQATGQASAPANCTRLRPGVLYGSPMKADCPHVEACAVGYRYGLWRRTPAGIGGAAQEQSRCQINSRSAGASKACLSH